MIRTLSRRVVSRRASLIVLFALLAIASGCSSSVGGRVTLVSDSGRRFSEKFTKGYIAASRDGEWDIVLLSDAASGLPKPRPAAPLEPVPSQPLKQVLHVQIFWKPMHGTEGKTPAVINSSVDWYVFGERESGKTDVLHYGGSAFTSLRFGKSKVDITFRDGSLQKPKAIGDLNDPLGSGSFSGSATAIRDDRQVHDILDAVKEQMDNAQHGTTAPPVLLP